MSCSVSEPNDAHETTTLDASRFAQLESENAALRSHNQLLRESINEAQRSYARLQQVYTRTLEQLQLARRRIFLAQAERAPVSAEAQLAFDTLLGEVKRIEAALDAAEAATESAGSEPSDPKPPSGKPKPKPKGRRNLDDDHSDLPVIPVVITNPELEGRVERIGFDYTYKLAYERGGMRRIEIATAKYDQIKPSSCANGTSSQPSDPDAAAESAKNESNEESSAVTADRTEDAKKALARFVKASMPPELFRRALLAPSLIAHLLSQKYMMGVPFHRLEKQWLLQGVSLDRGTMCRYAEDAGATLSALVEAMRAEAFQTAFCLSTDATGISIQPEPIADGRRQPCRKGYFFVTLADRDSIFFDYQERHTSAAVSAMFRGFTGYIQADAHAVYNTLFRPRAPVLPGVVEAPAPPPTEVACWSHSRRKFWEAAVCKHTVGLEGLRRINALFAIDETLKDVPPAKKRARRDLLLRPHIDAFFAWLHEQRARPRERGLVLSALGYAANHEQAFRRFLDDGRLHMTNNASERALRPIALGRNAWLFVGSDDHAHATANLFSLIASCKLHGIDPEVYFKDIIHLMPQWPRDRYLELTPKYWAQTRARLDPAQLEVEIGWVTIPPPLAAQEQAAAS